jgi:anti-sigma regulatory factor (Ser/Thr protein kinase)
MHELLPATLDSVATARHAVRRFAADLDVDLEAIVLAVSEAVANVVTHAYVDGTHGTVEVSALASPFEMTVTVRDRGRGLTEGNGTAGAGYGLLIIRRLAQHVELAETPDGIALTMGFPRGSGSSGRQLLG